LDTGLATTAGAAKVLEIRDRVFFKIPITIFVTCCFWLLSLRNDDDDADDDTFTRLTDTP
jgi:hypothetical protein